MAWSFGFHPNELDILNWNYKLRPNMDLIQEAVLTSEPEEIPVQEPPTPHSTLSRTHTGRPSMQGGQIDMATGVRSPSRGYSFAQEENGVAMRRIQSNLSGALPYTAPAAGDRKSRKSALLRTIRHPLRRKQPPAVAEPSS
jgi:phospholipid-translocating ATPase